MRTDHASRLETVLTLGPVVPVLVVDDVRTAVPLARALVGADAMLMSVERSGYDAERDGRLMTPQQSADPLDHPSWYHGFMFSQALTIGGGTFAVQRNIIGERVLGLPRDEDVTLGMSWHEAQRVGSGR